MLNIYHSSAHLFLCFHPSLPGQCQLWRLAQLQQSSVPLQFPLPDMVIATDATLSHCDFYFQGSEFPLYCYGIWSISMCKGPVAL